MCKPWVKLYTDFIYNRTIKKMKDAEQLTYIKLIVLAGREGDDGHLPSLEDCAIELSTKKTKLEKHLSKLIQLGVIEIRNGEYFVTNFEQKQCGVMTDAEKQKAYRERKKTKITPVTRENVTEALPSVTSQSNARYENVTLDKDKDIDIEGDKEEDEELNTCVTCQSNACSNAPAKTKKEVKHKYGEYQKVFLSDSELEKLKTEFPATWQQMIDRMDSYCASTGKTYKSFLATARNWDKRDKEKAKQAPNGGYATQADYIDSITEEDILEYRRKSEENVRKSREQDSDVIQGEYKTLESNPPQDNPFAIFERLGLS